MLQLLDQEVAFRNFLFHFSFNLQHMKEHIRLKIDYNILYNKNEYNGQEQMNIIMLIIHVLKEKLLKV